MSLVGIAETEPVELKISPAMRAVMHGRRRLFGISELRWMSGLTVKLLQLVPTKSCRRHDCGEKLRSHGEQFLWWSLSRGKSLQFD